MRVATAGAAVLLMLAVGVESYGGGAGTSAPALGRQMASDAAAELQEKAGADGARPGDAPAAAPAVPALRSESSGAGAPTPVRQAQPQGGPTQPEDARRLTGDADRGIGGLYVLRGVPVRPADTGRQDAGAPRVGAVTSGLGVLFALLFAATVGLWIRERSK